LRSSSTDAEQLIWRHLRNRGIAGFKFRRQHPVGSYIADFACIEAGLIVEIDGGQHFEPEALEADRHRTAVLQRTGFVVVRFDNWQVLRETESVLASIHDYLQRHPHPNPLPQAGEGANQEDRP
jgi:adenine-specific DNA-methyltransferase